MQFTQRHSRRCSHRSASPPPSSIIIHALVLSSPFEMLMPPKTVISLLLTLFTLHSQTHPAFTHMLPAFFFFFFIFLLVPLLQRFCRGRHMSHAAVWRLIFYYVRVSSENTTNRSKCETHSHTHTRKQASETCKYADIEERGVTMMKENQSLLA